MRQLTSGRHRYEARAFLGLPVSCSNGLGIDNEHAHDNEHDWEAIQTLVAAVGTKGGSYPKYSALVEANQTSRSTQRRIWHWSTIYETRLYFY
jgi:hypothetical protein